MDHPGKGKQTRSSKKKMVVCVGKRKEGGRGGEERSEENVTLVVCFFRKMETWDMSILKQNYLLMFCSFGALRSHWDEC